MNERELLEENEVLDELIGELRSENEDLREFINQSIIDLKKEVDNANREMHELYEMEKDEARLRSRQYSIILRKQVLELDYKLDQVKLLNKKRAKDNKFLASEVAKCKKLVAKYEIEIENLRKEIREKRGLDNENA